MMIELLCRYSIPFSKKKEQAIEDELKIIRLIKNDNFDEETERERIMEELGINDVDSFEYGEFCFNLKDVIAFNRIDAKHTVARFFNNAICVFKIDYESFKGVYQEETGMIIKCIITEDEILNDGNDLGQQVVVNE